MTERHYFMDEPPEPGTKNFQTVFLKDIEVDVPETSAPRFIRIEVLTIEDAKFMSIKQFLRKKNGKEVIKWKGKHPAKCEFPTHFSQENAAEFIKAIGELWGLDVNVTVDW